MRSPSSTASASACGIQRRSCQDSHGQRTWRMGVSSSTSILDCCELSPPPKIRCSAHTGTLPLSHRGFGGSMPRTNKGPANECARAFLKAYRQAAGLTQEHLSGRIEVKQQQISKYETGKDKVPFELVVTIEELWGVSVRNFMPPRKLANGTRNRIFYDEEAGRILGRFACRDPGGCQRSARRTDDARSEPD